MIPKIGSWHFKVDVAPSSMVLSNCAETRRIFGANSILRGWGEGLCCPLPLWGIMAPHSGTCPSRLDTAPCSACSPCLPEVTLTPLVSESPKGEGGSEG